MKLNKKVAAHFISAISGLVIAGVASSLIGSSTFLAPLAFVLGTQHRDFVNMILRRMK